MRKMSTYSNVNTPVEVENTEYSHCHSSIKLATIEDKFYRLRFVCYAGFSGRMGKI
ncbi:protein of unknown function [Shewanella benthica]|uniref:Uncharacterized protein n=1 Tax=Shewanella benthica TaxID=43661 RepID=A0A330M7F3_9GAMM|nr:protein of unknown function [Shewanella benthica]